MSKFKIENLNLQLKIHDSLKSKKNTVLVLYIIIQFKECNMQLSTFKVQECDGKHNNEMRTNKQR